MDKFMNYDFNISKIILACYVPAGSGQAVHKNRAGHGLAVNLEGIKEYEFSDNKKIVVKQNDIIYLPKHSNYKVTSTVSGACYAINFDLFEDIFFEPFVINIKNHSQIIERFRLAKNIWEKKKNGYIMKCKAELYNILYTMQQEYFSEYIPKNKLEIIRPAITYIHEKYTGEAISIEKLSDTCKITPEYFRRIFKSFYGISPVKYINNLKITRAKELIESGMYSVTDAAIQAGYTDMSHFSREFKKATGSCPSEYKKL